MVRQAKAGKHLRGRAIRRMFTRFSVLAAVMALLCWPLAVQAQQMVQPQNPASNQSHTQGKTSPPSTETGSALALLGYTISPGDLLDVYVVGVPELSRSYRVSPFGRITLPMLDRPIKANGLTPDELSQAIGDALRQQQLVSHPDVLVTVRSSPSNSIAVTGSVVNPGVYPVFGQTTLLDVLSKAGGLTPDASSTAVIMRGPKATQALEDEAATGPHSSAQTPPRIVRIPIRHLLNTGDEKQDVTLYPGDRVEVPRAGIIYVVGAVHRAGGFALTGGGKHLTVLQAIALAGNVTGTAASKNTVIIRPNSKSLTGHEQIKVNLKKILSGKASDRQLSAGDILFVPDSTGKRVFARAIEAATTVAIYRVPF